MSVGVRHFDEHHRNIINLIHELSRYEKESTGPARERTSGIIAELSSYVRYHFIAEERMMRTYHYPESMDHINEHRFFAGRVEDFMNRYASNQGGLDREILELLKQWFVNHIMKSDRKFGSFLNGHGVR